jgi:hypothetical protein
MSLTLHVSDKGARLSGTPTPAETALLAPLFAELGVTYDQAASLVNHPALRAPAGVLVTVAVDGDYSTVHVVATGAAAARGIAALIAARPILEMGAAMAGIGSEPEYVPNDELDAKYHR